ncbi:hypothetical protein D5R93_02860 [Actinomyces lilanjuaniae]|uniref:DUF4232 domain-containing protein n=1 Tax=Actinomyces lilanjuaniae TaxID=2321394 RepID=A0ABM6Z223_9ACTO|nr:hypothetical protein [Actinomyces lilanjuaniae]AYD89258.1 hypothetical protein D5R93_02860 [Actinomyces lilanjuaniae]
MAAVLLVVGVGAGAVGGAAWMRQTIRSQEQERAAAQTHTVYPDPQACDPASLATQVSGPESVSAGAGATFVLRVTNDGDVSCLLDAGSASLGVVVTSGSQQVWSSTACQEGASERTLLLGGGDSTEVTLGWNGYVTTSDCALAAAPAPGAQAEASASASPGGTTGPGQASTSPSAAPAPSDPGAAPEPSSASDPAREEPSAGQSSVAGQVAAAGTYRFRVVLGDQDLSEDTVFLVQ